MEFLPFFLVLVAAIFFSEVFRRLHLPWVIALILGGIAIGPFGFGWIDPSGNEILTFLGQVGLIFLMFMAGLETRFSGFTRAQYKLVTIGILNAGVPFLAGVAIALAFGVEMQGAILLGIIFISSAIAVVIPTLETSGLLGSRPGRVVTPVAVFMDIFSLVLLAVFLQLTGAGTSGLPVTVFLPLLLLSVIALRLIIPKIQWLISVSAKEEDEEGPRRGFEQDFRVVFAVLVGTVIIFELLGLHPIVGGFFAGLILSDTITSPVLKEKFKVAGYGLFIPVFFIVIGAQTDVGVIAELGSVFLLTLAIVVASMGSKFISGWIGGRIVGFSGWESALVGVSTLPQLSITLAVAFEGVQLNILSETMATSLVVLTMVTTFTAPLLVRWIGRKLDVRVV